MRKTRKCPSCGQQIYQYAQICPYCKSETHFSFIDEVVEQDVVSGVQSDEPVPEETADLEGTVALADDNEEGNRLEKVIQHLKEDKDKVKNEYKEKIASRFSTSTIVITSIIALLSIIVLVFFIAVQMMEQKTFSISTSVDNEMKAIIDSVETDLYQSSTIVAKFPDRLRHSMVYLRDGHLYLFDASKDTHEEIDLQGANPKAVVDFGGSGVLNAYLSTNEKYILIIASRNSGNTEFGFYRIGTSPDNLSVEVIDRGRVVPEKDGYTVSTDVRKASYDSNGDKVSGISGSDWEQMAPKVEKAKKQEKDEDKKERKTEHVSVTEHMAPTIDVVPQTAPSAPTAPEKINIRPVDTSN